jgi:hypothetical protein
MGYRCGWIRSWEINWKREREGKPTNSMQRILQFQLKHYNHNI